MQIALAKIDGTDPLSAVKLVLVFIAEDLEAC